MDSRVASSSIELVPDFGRYASAIRRLWWAIVAVAVAVGVVAFVASDPDGGATTVRFAVDQLDHEVSLENPLGYTPPRRRVTEQGAALSGDEVWARVGDALPGARRPRVQSNDLTSTLSLVVPGGPGAAEATVTAYLAELTALRRTAVTNASKTPLTVGGQLVTTLTDEIKALDAATTSGGPTVDAGIAFQRAELVRQRADLERSIAVLQQLPATADAGVQRLSSDHATVARVPRAILAAIGGAILALVGVLIAAFTDRRVRRRVDVERALGSGAFLGALRRQADEVELAAIAGALHALTDTGPVHLVGVAGYDARPLAASLAGLAAGTELVGTGALDGDRSVVAMVAEAPAVVLVAADGTASESEFVAAAHVISRAGGTVRGVVLAETRRPLGDVLG